MTTRRLKPKERKTLVLRAALNVAGKSHYAHMTRDQIAKAAGVAGPTVQHYLGTMSQLRRAVMRAAVQGHFLGVVAQGLVAKDPQALKAPESIREAALKRLADGCT